MRLLHPPRSGKRADRGNPGKFLVIWETSMKNTWVSAAAAVLATAGWAVAQSPGSSTVHRAGVTAASPLVWPTPAAPVAPAAAPGQVAPADLFPDDVDYGPPPYRVWGSADFLVWKLRSFTLPAIA